MFKILYSKLPVPKICKSICLSNNCYHRPINYYEILNLKKDCSEQDVRDSFVKLSKECHPDTSKSTQPENTLKFQRILEAYRVLSKPETRAMYDVDLKAHKIYTSDPGNVIYHTPWRETQRVHNVNPKPYYGFKRFKNRIPNITIVIALFLFASIGVLFQILLIRKSMTFRRDKLDERSALIGAQHASLRADAIKYGTEKQLERFINNKIKR